MLHWMILFANDSLLHREVVVILPSDQLNPEDKYYYQREVNGKPYRVINHPDAKKRKHVPAEEAKPISLKAALDRINKYRMPSKNA